MLIQVCLLVCLVSAVLAKGCCLPEQWEGKMYGSGFYRIQERTPVGETESASVAYDTKIKKLAVYGEAIVNGESKKYKIIEDFSKGQHKIHIIQPDSKTCWTNSTPELEFPKLCTPESAEERKESFVGAGENSLGITVYELKWTDYQKDITIFNAVTTEGCVPVYTSSAGKDGNNKFYQHTDYVGITVGIKNSDIFDVPNYCDRMTFDPTRDKLQRISRWNSYWM